jgi:putative chitinase
MRLTQHFELDEFLADGDIKPGPAVVRRLTLVAEGLERLRAVVRAPCLVTSGWRSVERNRRVGGVPTSAHLVGWAADVHFAGVPVANAVALLRGASPRRWGQFDQLVVEGSRRILHCSFDPRFRMQWLWQPGGPGTAVYPFPAY